MENRTCEHCGKDMTGKRADSKYCSSTCRGYASKKRKDPSYTSGQQLSFVEEEPKQPKAPKQHAAPSFGQPSSSMTIPLNGLDAKSAYIVYDLNKKNDDLQKKLDKSETKVETLSKEVTTLKDQIRQNEFDQQMKDNQKPSGLEGLMENPVVQGLVPHIAPHLGEAFGMLLKKFLPPVGGAQLEGNANANEFLTWLSSTPEQVQVGFYSLMQEISRVPVEQIGGVLSKLTNVLKNGSTMPKVTAYATATGTY